MAGTSTNADKHPYTRGYQWWARNAFWRFNPHYSEKSRSYFEKWLDDMRANEKRLIRL